MISALWFIPLIVFILLLSDIFFKGNRWKSIFLFFILFLVWGGNELNGADWLNYSKEYERLTDIRSIFEVGALGQFEWLFSILLWMFSSLKIPYLGFVAFIGLINTSCLMWVMGKLKIENRGQVLAMLFLIEGWTLYHEQLRQAVAVSLCMVAFVQFINKKKLAAFFIVFIATGFHSSAIFSLAIFYLIRVIEKRDGKPISIKESIYASLILIFGIFVILEFVKYGVFSHLGLIRLQEKFAIYQSDEVYGSSLFTAGIVAYPIGLFILLQYRKLAINNANIWYSLAWSGAILWCFLGPCLRMIAILIRFEHYLLIFFPFVIGIYSFSFKGKKEYKFSWLLIFLFSCTFMVRIAISPEHQIWINNYQNTFLGYLFGLPEDDMNKRQEIICNHLSEVGNNFCE
ncbi:hypothetical protein GN109_00525 [Collimonas pratensis]|uniref:EpsG family protein n=1 Tax=Collimonas pratensis TaxID=279113 RepID=UPI00143CCD59|nr:EpsG family protein [Collimonas pratensis]NKI67889.1 hypothetical protein [Collimonas pratensis]